MHHNKCVGDLTLLQIKNQVLPSFTMCLHHLRNLMMHKVLTNPAPDKVHQNTLFKLGQFLRLYVVWCCFTLTRGNMEPWLVHFMSMFCKAFNNRHYYQFITNIVSHMQNEEFGTFFPLLRISTNELPIKSWPEY